MLSPSQRGYIAAACAFFGTWVFHVTAAEHIYGFALAILTWSLVGLLILLAYLAERRLPKTWAWLFLIPLAFSTFATIMWASDVVRALAPLMMFISLVGFAYWIGVEGVSWDAASTLAPKEIFKETLFPVAGSSFIRAFKTDEHRHVPMVAFGLVLAIPVLLVIGALFASADPLFREAVIDPWFNWDGMTMFRLVRDVVVLVFLVYGSWSVMTRLLEKRFPSTTPRSLLEHTSTVAAVTILTCVGAFVLIFLGFQVISGLIDNAAVFATHTHAELAREGFFQLLVVSLIIFGLVSLVSFWTRMTASVRWLSAALLVETLLLMMHATGRLFAYIDAFGLTVDRVWALMVEGGIAALCVMLITACVTRYSMEQVRKMIVYGALTAVSFTLMFNVDGMVARYNIQHGATLSRGVDWSYLMTLSSDAVPAIVTAGTPAMYQHALEFKKNALKHKANEDWRNLVISDYRALSVFP